MTKNLTDKTIHHKQFYFRTFSFKKLLTISDLYQVQNIFFLQICLIIEHRINKNPTKVGQINK